MWPLASLPCGDSQVDSVTLPPPTWLFGVTVSHSQLSLKPCGFWLLASQMISYMIADAPNLCEVKMFGCRAGLMVTDEGGDC